MIDLVPGDLIRINVDYDDYVLVWTAGGPSTDLTKDHVGIVVSVSQHGNPFVFMPAASALGWVRKIFVTKV